LFDAFVGVYKDELDKAYCRLTLDGTLAADKVLGLIDEEAARLSVDDYLAAPGVAQFCANPMRDLRRWDCDIPMAHDMMRAWVRARPKTVMQRLNCQ
jgi:hypothetical protein